MPKSTFFNLAQTKRDRIIQAAIDEFSTNSYELASINRIVEQSGISKGSLYQYFEDKEDLYVYLIENSIECKVAFLEPFISNLDGKTFFNRIRDLFEAGIDFAKQHPEWVAIGERFAMESPNEVQIRILQKYGHLTQNTFENLIHQAIEKGELSKEIDPMVVSLLIAETGAAISKVAANDWVRMASMFESLIKVLEEGIKR